jgi:hypothetical protein
MPELDVLMIRHVDTPLMKGAAEGAARKHRKSMENAQPNDETNETRQCRHPQAQESSMLEKQSHMVANNVVAFPINIETSRQNGRQRSHSPTSDAQYRVRLVQSCGRPPEGFEND